MKLQLYSHGKRFGHTFTLEDLKDLDLRIVDKSDKSDKLVKDQKMETALADFARAMIRAWAIT